MCHRVDSWRRRTAKGQGIALTIVNFDGTTANEVWLAAAERFGTKTQNRQRSRAGDTAEILHAGFSFSDPRQRWVTARQPAINPAFAIAETLWMIAGQDDAASLNYWNPKLASYAGRTTKYRGAYGRRLRGSFGIDQLRGAARALESSPESRQVVLQIWDAREDLPGPRGRPRREDIPCNICSFLKIRGGRLQWTQILRSNDLFLGVPHNFVQFTTLQEIMAGWLGVPLGKYTHFSDSLHMYERDRPLLAMTSTSRRATNSDSLGLGWEESKRVLAKVWRRTLALSSSSLTPAKLTRLLSADDLPEPYENLVRVLAADSSRRRQWPDQMHQSMIDCRNPALRFLWDAWLKRRVGEGSAIQATP